MPVETTSIARGMMSGYAFSSLPDYVISAGPRVKGCDRCSGSSSA